MQSIDLPDGVPVSVLSGEHAGKIVQRVETECGSILVFFGEEFYFDPGRFWSEPLECEDAKE